MPDNDSDAVLPIPSDLYRDMAGLQDRIEVLRADLTRTLMRYRELGQSPDSLAVDNLGEPIEPAEANARVLHGLQLTDCELQAAAEWLSTTSGRYASRLKLTDTADQHRERQLARQRRRRTR
ncbi:hypothetical protein NONI108955_34345 [Nocardia ninae]|uniref:Uncharacterized protein n=1 Tax=Nocardia ninae NBRC 108245 TaxID=1210091 RepID=A0A511MSX0_9NOCA|nr:hypothetical protein [Nocardia ninae]GEM43338.1 hypothetical protein NN4_78570 [Nocardia ninae NBRC 108245]